MKKRHAKRSWIFFMVLALVLVLGKTPVFAASVSDFNELKAAVAAGGDIQLKNNITVTETLEIKNNVTITGGKILKAGNSIKEDPNSGNIFYVNEGKSLKLDGVTLDGDNKARLIYSNGGKIELKDSTLQNGCPGDKAKANPGGGVFLRGGSLTATDTDFKNNTPGTTQGLGEGDRDLNGGAIYSGSTKADIKITGGSFTDNEVKAYGHGAAIYQENGTLTVDGTSFKNNKGHVEGGNAGTQGACIHTRDRVKATISDVNAEIAKGFNTGGFLRSWGSNVTVTNSTFTIKDLGDGYGYSGGALCFENGKSKVTGSTFTCIGSKLYHAGGFIDIVGGGEHVIDDNNMTGSGKENGKQIASFGGAISVEQGASATVTIKGNTIEKTSTSDNGGAIAIGTRKGVRTPSTVTMSGNKISNGGTLVWGGQAGGGVFVGPDAKVIMTGDTVSNNRAALGGGVYNEGTLTITGGSSLTGGQGGRFGGEIYNNGTLTVDDATVDGGFIGFSTWEPYNPGHGKTTEYAGVNIYAAKDVTITPKAKIAGGKDVRVIDGKSKILLTGALTNQIDVSISEVAAAGEKPFESVNRRIGYVVAGGTKGYEVTKSDANKLHYFSKAYDESKPADDANQPIAKAADDTSPGMWDFVLDKENGKVVVGQRVKLVYHGNLGKIGEEDKKEKTVDVYKNPEFWKGEGQLKNYKVADPTLDGSSFMGWYFWKDGASARTTDDTIQNIKIPNDLKDKLFDFSRVTFKNNVKDTDQIITPNIIHTYAGWSQNVSIPVLKDWGDTEEDDKVDVTVTLIGGEKDEKITLTSTNNYHYLFDDLRVFTKSYKNNEEKNMNLKFTPKTYSVVEKPIDGFATSYSPLSMIANQVAEISQFVVTNTKVKTGNVFVKYVAEDGTVLEAESKVVENAKVGTDYTTEQKTFDGYEYLAMGEGSAEASGRVVAGDLHVIYVYKAKTGNVFVKYITEDGKVLEEESPVLENAKVGTAYTTEQKVFKGYDFSKMEENSAEPNGKVVAGDLHVIYVYKKTESQPPTTKVITQYVDEQGNRLIPDRAGKQPVVEIKDYTYLRTEESDTLIRHIYKKIQVPVHPSGSTLILPTPGATKPVPDDGLLNKKDHKAYMFGYPDTNFLPERNMTREEATAMFARLLKDYPRERRNYTIPFKDVAESDWSQQAIGFMLEKGMIKGYEDGSFRPKAAISRAEFAAMAARFDKLVAGRGNSFFDVPAGHWAQGAIDSAAAKGWVTGYPDGSFKPERKITRAEVVNITNKMLDRFADKDFVRSHLSEMIQFKDLTEADWAYFPIMEATNGHDYTRRAAQEENWIRLNGEEFRFVVVGRK